MPGEFSNNPLLDVPNVEAITLLHVAELEDGATAIPADQNGRRWNLVKGHGGTPNGYSVLRPAAGSPIAGGASDRWILQDTAASTVIAQYFDALDADTTVLGDTTVSVAELQIPVTSASNRVRLEASIAFRFTRDGLSSFFLEINGNIVTGGQFGTSSSTNAQRTWAMVYRFNPAVGTNTVRLLVRPVAPVGVEITVATDPSIRHAHLAATVFSS